MRYVYCSVLFFCVCFEVGRILLFVRLLFFRGFVFGGRWGGSIIVCSVTEVVFVFGGREELVEVFKEMRVSVFRRGYGNS